MIMESSFLQELYAFIVAIFLLLILLAVCVFLFIYELKQRQKIKEYRKTLSYEDRKAIDDYKENTQLTLEDFKKRGKVDEDK